MIRTSFQQLWEDARSSGRDFWTGGNKDDLDSSSLDVLKRGMEIRPDRTDGNTFWDDFMLVFGNNVDGAAKLLNVSPDSVSQWSGLIKKGLSQVRPDADKDDLVKTGDHL